MSCTRCWWPSSRSHCESIHSLDVRQRRCCAALSFGSAPVWLIGINSDRYLLSGRQRADKHSLCHDMTAPPAKWETNRRHAEIWTLTKDLCNASDTTRSTKRRLETLRWSRTLLVKTGRNYRRLRCQKSFSFNQGKSHAVGGFGSWCEKMIRDGNDQRIH